MMKYIALLRGVNVGGKNQLSMRELKDAFLQHGFSDVSTYINSGNIIFSSESTDEAELKAVCESFIESRFGIKSPVFIISANDLADALRQAPAWWNADAESKHNAIFVLPPAAVEEVYAQVEGTKPAHEKAACFGRVIFWAAPGATFSRARLSQVAGSFSRSGITIRNANTTLKLLALAQPVG